MKITKAERTRGIDELTNGQGIRHVELEVRGGEANKNLQRPA